MTSEPYLIAHIVRGEPTFDIAIRCDMPEWGTSSDPAPWWLIPTSGHRAYPYWDVQLDTLFTTFTCLDLPPPAPEDWPDHYAPSAALKGQGLITNLAERLGLIKRPIITRR